MRRGVSNMRAIQVTEHGGPEVLKVRDVPIPEPGPGLVRVKVEAAGINFIDVYQRSGAYKLPLPMIPGSEGAGVVDAVGTDVTDFAPGDRVAFAQGSGAYAEYALVPAAKLFAVPDAVESRTAAAV